MDCLLEEFYDGFYFRIFSMFSYELGVVQGESYFSENFEVNFVDICCQLMLFFIVGFILKRDLSVVLEVCIWFFRI